MKKISVLQCSRDQHKIIERSVKLIKQYKSMMEKAQENGIVMGLSGVNEASSPVVESTFASSTTTTTTTTTTTATFVATAALAGTIEGQQALTAAEGMNCEASGELATTMKTTDKVITDPVPAAPASASAPPPEIPKTLRIDL